MPNDIKFSDLDSSAIFIDPDMAAMFNPLMEYCNAFLQAVHEVLVPVVSAYIDAVSEVLLKDEPIMRYIKNVVPIRHYSKQRQYRILLSRHLAPRPRVHLKRSE